MPSSSKGRGGVLPVNAAQTRKSFKQPQRSPPPRLRLIIRRLPPGLTETEFWDSLGSEWQVGQGKTDWAAYKPGKISKDLAKPSRPARAYLKVKEPALLDVLSSHVKTITFQDAKNSTRDPCLIGPPTLEFAPYTKIPGGRMRHDGRQGTIDQDPEFIDFLQSLTEPITKPGTNGEPAEAKPEKVAITPLVQYIKEKKASKAKEKEAAAAAKAATKKAQDSKEAKTAAPAKAEQAAVVKKAATNDPEKTRVAKATQQAVDSIKRSVAEIKGNATPAKQDQQAAAKTATNPTQQTPKKERQRGDASAAARIIGRDLGLTPKEGRTPRNQRSVTTPAAAAASATASSPGPGATVKSSPQQPAASAATAAATAAAASSPSPQQPAQGSPTQPPTGPRNLRNATPQPSPLRPTPIPQPVKNAKPPPQPSPGAKSAFLKHANPSQGVTEDLLRETFSVHGTITRCEIDKKKGLGYIDFTDTDALRKAMAASPVKVGNGSVVVLENRSPYKKAPQTPIKSNTASPKPSTPSSPQVSHASLATVAEQGPSEAAASAGAAASPAQLVKAEANDATSATPQSDQPATAASTESSANPTSPTTTAQAQAPSATRGSGRGGHRGYRGRGGFRGRGGQFRGGNRAASTPVNGTGGSNPPPSAPTEPKS